MDKTIEYFRSKRDLFMQHSVDILAKSNEYANIERALDRLLVLSDRILLATQDDREFNRVFDVAKKLNTLDQSNGNPTEFLKSGEDLLEDIELWLRVILWLAKPSEWQNKKDLGSFTLPKVMMSLDLLTQTESEKKHDKFYEIPDEARQLLLLAYRYRNPLTHSPKDWPDHIRGKFPNYALAALIAPVYKYENEISLALRNLITSPINEPNIETLLIDISSERQKHIDSFKGRTRWIEDLSGRLLSDFDVSKPYILLHGIEGSGKSALIAKLSEHLSIQKEALGRYSLYVRKTTPWLPGVFLHFGKKSNQPTEIVRSLICQINTTLLQPRELPQLLLEKTSRLEQVGYIVPNREIPQTAYRHRSLEQFSSESLIEPISAKNLYQYNQYLEKSISLKVNNDLRRSLLLSLEQVVSEYGPVVMMIDALDEISHDGSELDFLPDPLPKGVAAILTARTNSKAIDWLRGNRTIELIKLEGFDEDEIPLFTGFEGDVSEEQQRFNRRLWRDTKGWPLFVLPAASIAKEQKESLDKVVIDSTISHVFERQSKDWQSNTIDGSDLLYEILLFLAMFEPVSPVNMDWVQSFLESKGRLLTRDYLTDLLQPVSAQIDGLDVNRLKLAVKAFAEYVREKKVSHKDLGRFLEGIVSWLSNEEDLEPRIIALFLSYWANPEKNRKEIVEIAERLIDNLISQAKFDLLFDLYVHSKPNLMKGAEFIPFTARCLRASAELGNQEAMRIFGNRLLDGAGLHVNVEEGTKWLLKAANAGNTSAMENLAKRYLDGDVLPIDKSQGEIWLQKAISLNSEDAKIIYAKRLIKGDGLERDPNEGLRILDELGNAGSQEARYLLAQSLIFGDDYYSDPEMGENILQQLSDEGYELASLGLAMRLISGSSVLKGEFEGEKLLRKLAEQGVKPAVLLLAIHLIGKNNDDYKDEVETLLTKQASAGETEAMILLAEMILDEQFPNRKYEDGIHWLEKAADQENTEAMSKLGILLMEGTKTKKLVNEGRSLLQKAIDKGDANAMRILALKLLEGKQLPKDQKLGFSLLSQAAEKGDVIAMAKLGQRLLYGEDIKQDIQKGEFLLRKAAEKEYPEACLILGEALTKSIILKKDLIEGEKLIRKAAETDDHAARMFLGINLILGIFGRKEVAEGETILWKLIEDGEKDIKAFLGGEYLTGKNLPQDIERGLSLLREAISDGSSSAKKILGINLIRGEHVSSDLQEGEKLLRAAIAEGDESAKKNLASFLIEGDKLPQNKKEGKALWVELANARDIEAMDKLADYCLTGKLEGGEEEGIRWIKRIIRAGENWAYGKFGLIYYNKGDLKTAINYFKEGIRSNDINSMNDMAYLIRRKEISIDQVGIGPLELLNTSIEKKYLFGHINLALCYAQGCYCTQDWCKADELIQSLRGIEEDAKDALSWWHNELATKNDPEGHLVIGWLCRYGLVEDPDGLSVAQRMAFARQAGFDIPSWMDVQKEILVKISSDK